MGYLIGRGRRASETYPERPGAGAPSGSPFVNLKYVDYGTLTPVGERDGSVGKPYGTLQAGLDAGFTCFYLTGGSINEDVTTVAGLFFLTGANRSVGLGSLTIPDSTAIIVDDVQLNALVCGDGCLVQTTSPIGNATFGLSGFLISGGSVATSSFGDGGFFVANGPGALSFPGKIDLLTISNTTMTTGSSLIATNAVIHPGSVITCDAIEMFACTSAAASMTALGIAAQNCQITAGVYTTTEGVELQDVKVNAGVSFDNDAGHPFNVDGYTNYWLKTNAVALSNAGAKVITEDLTP